MAKRERLWPGQSRRALVRERKALLEELHSLIADLWPGNDGELKKQLPSMSTLALRVVAESFREKKKGAKHG